MPCMCSPFSHLSIDVSTTHIDTISRVKFTFAKTLLMWLGKMIGRSVENANEIRADMQMCTLLSRASMDINADICTVYGSNSMSFPPVCRWVRQFSASVRSVTSAKSCRSKSASSPKIFFCKIRRKIYFSADCGHGWNFKSICIALFALGWSHLCSMRSKNAHMLGWRTNCWNGFQDMIRKYLWMNFWIHYFELHRKISNRVWLTKNESKPCIAKRITIMKCKVLKWKEFLENLSNSTRNVDRRWTSVVFIFYMTTPQVTRPEVWHLFWKTGGLCFRTSTLFSWSSRCGFFSSS